MDYRKLAKIFVNILFCPEYRELAIAIKTGALQTWFDAHPEAERFDPGCEEHITALFILAHANAYGPIALCIKGVNSQEEGTPLLEMWEKIANRFKEESGYTLEYIAKFLPSVYLYPSGIVIYLTGIENNDPTAKE